MPEEIVKCPICGTDQHVLERTEDKLFLGCRHSIDAFEPEPEPELKLCSRCGNAIEADAPAGVDICGSCADELRED